MSDYLVLDIETQRLSTEVKGGWNNIGAFGLAIAVVMYSDGHTAIFDEGNVDILISECQLAQRIITFNGIRFDYEVLGPYGLDPKLLYPKSFDILHEMQKVLGHRVSLASVAYATFEESKSGDGKDAVKWFREGKIDKVIEYCKHDVEITRRIYEFICAHGYCFYEDLRGSTRICQLKGATQQVSNSAGEQKRAGEQMSNGAGEQKSPPAHPLTRSRLLTRTPAHPPKMGRRYKT